MKRSRYLALVLGWNKKKPHKKQAFFSYRVWVKLWPSRNSLTLLGSIWRARATSGGNLTLSLKSNTCMQHDSKLLHPRKISSTGAPGRRFQNVPNSTTYNTNHDWMLSGGRVRMVHRCACICGCVYVCQYACRGQRTPSGVIPQEQFTLFLKQTLSLWPGTCHATSLADQSVSPKGLFSAHKGGLECGHHHAILSYGF